MMINIKKITKIITMGINHHILFFNKNLNNKLIVENLIFNEFHNEKLGIII